MASPDITVLVPTYGHDKVIVRALQSVIEQSAFLECNVIVSDDCSPGNNFDIVESFSRDYPNIVARRTSSNLGVMRHYQDLSNLIESPYVAVLEGDDHWISPFKLENQLRALQNSPGAGLCFSRLEVANEGGDSWWQPRWQRGRNRFVSFSELLEDNHVGTFSTCMYRTDCFKDAVHRGQAGYDWLVNLLIAAQNDVIFLDEPATRYNVSSTGTWSSLSVAQKSEKIVSTLEALERSVDKWQALFVREAISRVISRHV